MSDGIYVALSGAIAQSTSLDVTAANLANAGTDGYQRNRPVFREELMRAGSGSSEPGSRYTSIASTQLDTTRGALRPTGNALDFSMPEGTYLSVSTARGERYTRAASLSVSRDGTLQTRTAIRSSPTTTSRSRSRATRAASASTTPASSGRAATCVRA